MTTTKRLKIAFVNAFDVKDVKNLSGSPYHLAILLNERVGNVDYIDNLRPSRLTLQFFLNNPFTEFAKLCFIECLKKALFRVFRKKYHWDRTFSISNYFAKKIKEKLQNKNYDIIFAEKANVEIALLDTNIPIICNNDATFKLLVDYYPDFSNFSEGNLKSGVTLDKIALEKARVCIFTSKWAANSAIQDYGIPENKIRVIPYPLNLKNIPTKETVLQKKRREVCNLLFIGLDWKRKGGDKAVETVNLLNKKGIKSILNIVGCIPPKKVFKNKYVNIVGFLKKDDLEDSKMLNALFLSAHFLLLPTRAECTAQVFSEAAVYGLPIISTNTGGVASLVHNGENGVLLGLGALPIDFAREIERIWGDIDVYNTMREKSRLIFEQKLSNEVWVASINKAISEICLKT